MDKKSKVLSLLCVIFATALVVANCIANKLFPIFGGVITAGAIAYPVTFLMTDVIGQRYGRKEAQHAVKLGFIAQLVALVMTWVGGLLTDANGVQGAYQQMFGSSWLLVLGSLTAYAVSQTVDVAVFHSIKEAWESKHHNSKGKWIWNNVGTITAQLVDSAVYAGIVYTFVFHMPWFPNAEQGIAFGSTILCSILIQWGFKSLLALCDTPIFYLLTREGN